MRPFASLQVTLAILIGGIAGALVLVGPFYPNILSTGLLAVAQTLIAAAVLFGVAHLLAVHLRRSRGPQGGRLPSLVLVVVAIATFALQMAVDFVPELVIWSADLLLYVYQPLATSLLALLTFFALRAALRAVQLRPGEASVIVVVAALFLISGGPWAAAVPGLQQVLEWSQAYPAMGVARGLLLGVGIGATIASIRLLLGFDQPYFDR